MIRRVEDSDSSLWDVIDIVTGERIPGVQWADDENEIYEVFLYNEIGEIKICPTCDHIMTEIKRGKIKFVKKEEEK